MRNFAVSLCFVAVVDNFCHSDDVACLSDIYFSLGAVQQVLIGCVFVFAQELNKVKPFASF